MLYAMIQDNGQGQKVCRDVRPAMPGEDELHPTLRALFREVPDGTENGWFYDETTGQTSAPQAGPLLPGAVPSFVTNAQARVVLLRTPSGPGRTLFDDVDAACHALGGETLQFWDYANEITRKGQLVRNLAAQLGLTDEQLDELFRQAKLIEA